MALTAADLLAIREQQLAFQVLQEGSLDSRLNDLKAVLADIQSAQDLDTAKKDLDSRQVAIDKQTADLYNKSIDLETQASANADANQKEKDKLVTLLNSVKDREGALASGVASLMDQQAAFEAMKSSTEADLTSRQESLAVSEGILATKLANIQSREDALTKKLEVLKGI